MPICPAPVKIMTFFMENNSFFTGTAKHACPAVPAFSALCVLLGGGFVDTAQGVQTAGVADIGQALGEDLDEERLVIANPQIGGGVGGKLGLTSALGRRESRR